METRVAFSVDTWVAFSVEAGVAFLVEAGVAFSVECLSRDRSISGPSKVVLIFQLLQHNPSSGRQSTSESLISCHVNEELNALHSSHTALTLS